MSPDIEALPPPPKLCYVAIAPGDATLPAMGEG